MVSGLRGMLLGFTTDVFSDPGKTTHRDDDWIAKYYHCTQLTHRVEDVSLVLLRATTDSWSMILTLPS